MEGPKNWSNETPPFLSRTYHLVDDPATDNIISWSGNSTRSSSFVVWKPIEFAEKLLPKYFKHSNISSFVRQLNHYGFRKVDPDLFEFRHDKFVRFQPHLLSQITRNFKKGDGTSGQTPASTQTSGLKMGNSWLKEEIERFNRDKDTIFIEVVKLRQHQQASRRTMQMINQRLQRSQKLEQQMMGFLGSFVGSPELLAQLFLQNQHNNRLDIREVLLSGQGKSISRFETSGPEGQILKFQANHDNVVRPGPGQLPTCSESPISSKKDIGKGARNIYEEAKRTDSETHQSGPAHLSTGQDALRVDSIQIQASQQMIRQDNLKDLIERSSSVPDGELIHFGGRDFANHDRTEVPDSDPLTVPPTGRGTASSTDVHHCERIHGRSVMVEGVEVLPVASHSATGNHIEENLFRCFHVTLGDNLEQVCVEVPDSTGAIHVTHPNGNTVPLGCSPKVSDQEETKMDFSDPESKALKTSTSLDSGLDYDVDSLLESLPSLQLSNGSDLLDSLLRNMELELASSYLIVEDLEETKFQNLSDSSFKLPSFN